ncbi:unnamed protein product, partial [Ascophyllum nodosum]
QCLSLVGPILRLSEDPVGVLQNTSTKVINIRPQSSQERGEAQKMMVMASVAVVGSFKAEFTKDTGSPTCANNPVMVACVHFVNHGGCTTTSNSSELCL